MEVAVVRINNETGDCECGCFRPQGPATAKTIVRWLPDASEGARSSNPRITVRRRGEADWFRHQVPHNLAQVGSIPAPATNLSIEELVRYNHLHGGR